MRHLTEPTPQAGRRRRLALTLAVLAVMAAGCGGSSPPREVGRVVDESARSAATATQLSRELIHRWCPRALHHRTHGLTQRQARRCLQRARTTWLRELRRNGYDPKQVASP